MAITRLFLGLVLATGVMPVSADAGWREDLGTFRIGMVAPGGDAAAIEGIEAIRAGFSAALGMPVEVFAARDYAGLADAQATGRIQYAIHTATSYAATSLLCSCVDPIAAPVSADGATGIRSILVSRPDGPATPAAAATARLAIGPDDSVAGRLIPIAEFRPGGSDLSGTEPFLVPVASQTEAEAKLRAGEVDAMFGFVQSDDDGATRGGTPERLAAAGIAGAKVIWTSDLLRNGPHAVRSNVPEEAKTALTSFLLGLQASDPKLYDRIERRFSGGFAEVGASDYASAVALVRRSGRPTPAQ